VSSEHLQGGGDKQILFQDLLQSHFEASMVTPISQILADFEETVLDVTNNRGAFVFGVTTSNTGKHIDGIAITHPSAVAQASEIVALADLEMTGEPSRWQLGQILAGRRDNPYGILWNEISTTYHTRISALDKQEYMVILKPFELGRGRKADPPIEEIFYKLTAEKGSITIMLYHTSSIA